MQQFITDGYTRSRMRETVRSLVPVSDHWVPPTRGPALLERVGLTLVSVGVSMVRDRALLDRLVADQSPKAA